MKYQVLEHFRVKTSHGELELQYGQIITLPHDKAIKLLNDGKITPVEKVAYRIYSEILQEHLWIVDTDQDMYYLRTQGISGAVYIADEIRKLKGKDADFIREIHKVKEVFPESKIKEIKPREDKG